MAVGRGPGGRRQGARRPGSGDPAAMGRGPGGRGQGTQRPRAGDPVAVGRGSGGRGLWTGSCCFFRGRISSHLGISGDIPARRQLLAVIQKTILTGTARPEREMQR